MRKPNSKLFKEWRSHYTYISLGYLSQEWVQKGGHVTVFKMYYFLFWEFRTTQHFIDFDL